MANIGFIGLGHMGNPMVKNLLKHAHTVRVFDLVEEASEALVAQGATRANSLEDVVKNSEVIITMLPSGKHVKDVCINTLFNVAKSGTLIIDSSSIEIGISRELEILAKKKQLSMIDAPVSGGVAGAVSGTLTFMVGGAEKDFKRAEPILASMGKAVIYAGPAGNGQAAKICNNMILGISMIAVSEAFALAKKLGLDAQTFFNISSISSGQCWSMTSYCPVPGPVPLAPSNHHYQPGFTAAMMLKDLHLSQDAAASVNMTTPLGAHATALYETFNQKGNAQLDFSGIIKMIEEKQ